MSLYTSEAAFKAAIIKVLNAVIKYDSCEFCNKLALKFEEASLAEVSFTSSFELGKWASNPQGNVHGGVTAAVLDQSMGILATCMAGGRITPTVSMNISYSKPIPLDKKIFLKSYVVSSGKTMVNTACKIWIEGYPGKTAASSTGIYHIPQK